MKGFKKVRTKKGIWTDWSNPVMNRYHMACCDCSLVHTINFRAIKIIKRYKNGTKVATSLPKDTYQVQFKMFRNNKLTKQERNIK